MKQEDKSEEPETEEDGNGNVAFEDDGINMDSFTSTAQIIKREKPALKRVNTMMYQVKDLVLYQKVTTFIAGRHGEEIPWRNASCTFPLHL